MILMKRRQYWHDVMTMFLSVCIFAYIIYIIVASPGGYEFNAVSFGVLVFFVIMFILAFLDMKALMIERREIKQGFE